MRIIVLTFMALCLSPGSGRADPQNWPARTIEMIMPWGAGGGGDIVARTMAKAMSDELGQTIVVVNRDGAVGTLGFNALSAAAPDGYTLGAGPMTPVTIAPYFVKGLRFDVGSFDYICAYFDHVFALAVPDGSPLTTVSDLIAAAKANPGKLSFGTAGTWSYPHLAAESFALGAAIKVQQIPFRGDAQMLPDLLRGELDFGSIGVASIRGQAIRPLVIFSERRHPAFPDVPTAGEAGNSHAMLPNLQGIFAPKGIPAPIRARLEAACEQAVNSNAVRDGVQTIGGVVRYLPGEQFHAQVLSASKQNADFIRRLNLETK